jgi:hypothetical protein
MKKRYMTSPPWKFFMLAAWLDGYSDGLPDYCETEKARTKEASALLMEVYENHMKESEKWKQEMRDQA